MQKYLILISMLVFLGCGNSETNNSSETNSKLTWTAINVNAEIKRGDAHLISNNGKHFLIDAGHTYYAHSVLIPYLESVGVNELEGILITHPHADHYGGVEDLIENNFKIKTIHMNMPTRERLGDVLYDGLLRIKTLAESHNIEIVPIIQGDRLVFDKNSFIEVLYIYDGINTPIGTTSVNDMSAITMIYDGKNRFLLTGDLDKSLGKYLAENANNIQADILKAPHHGIETFAPNSFFEKVNPKVLIVPSPQHFWSSEKSSRIRELARKYHYETYVNGFHGHITVTSDGNTYTIKTEKEVEDILYQ